MANGRRDWRGQGNALIATPGDLSQDLRKPVAEISTAELKDSVFRLGHYQHKCTQPPSVQPSQPADERSMTMRRLLTRAKFLGCAARRGAQSAIELLARRRQTGRPAHALRGERLKNTDTVAREADRGGGEIGYP